MSSPLGTHRSCCQHGRSPRSGSWLHGRAQAGGVEPLTASLLSELALEAGLPAGVLNTVHGLGESAGKALTEHPLIRAIAFVGESATGSLIQAQGAPTLKRVHFELGGKTR